jgi:DNA-binding LacI/PurR family transcriptional regulator
VSEGGAVSDRPARGVRPPRRKEEAPPRVDIAEIARRAGVARSTVSYALSGKRPISPEKRERILRLVEELGYRPNVSARALAEGRSRMVGLVIPPPSHRLLDSQLAFIAELSELASSADLDLVLSPSSGDHDRSFRRMLSGSRVDGVLVMEVRMRDERIAALEQSGVPYVLIGRPADPGGLFWADIEYGGLVERCVQHLADLGHRNVALLNRSADLLASGYGPAHRAANAFEAAVARHGLRGHAFCCPDDAAGGELTVKELLATRPRITAAITINESALSGVSRALDRAHVRIPRDLSLVGVLGERWAQDFHPPMTAAVISPAKLAQGAFEMLLQRIADPRAEPRHLLQFPAITLGATTGRVALPAGRRSSKG